MSAMKFCPLCGSPLAGTMLAGRERLACSASCGYVFWDNPVPVVAGIVELGDSVVLIRNKEWPERFLGIVAGFLEKDESPEEAILRELKEELGLEGEIVDFVGNYGFSQKNQVILAYHIKAHGEIVLGDELAAYKLVPPSELRPWSLGTGPALKDWLANREESKHDEGNLKMAEQINDHAGVRIHPPVLMAIHLAVAILLEWLVPLPLPVPKFVFLIGWIVVILGLVSAFGGLRQLIRAHTSPDPHSPTTSVVRTGVYRFTRNPIYIGYLCVLIGIPLIFGNYWGLVLSPLQVVLFNRLIIRHEEVYLSGKFGTEYLDYKQKVGRWL